MKLLTTLNIIRSNDPCEGGWGKLLNHLGKTNADDEPLEFATILQSNGLDDALWAIRAVIPEHEHSRDRLARLFAADCAEKVLHIFEAEYPSDDRPQKAIEAARKFADGLITREELDAAGAAALAAGRAAGADAWGAARAAEAAVRAAGAATWAAEAAEAAEAAAWAVRAAEAAWAEQQQLFIRYFCAEEAQ